MCFCAVHAVALNVAFMLAVNAWCIYFGTKTFEAVCDELQMASALLSTLDEKGPVSKSCVITSELRSLNDFPDEILLKILSHFGPEDLCLIIAKVCERWNALAKDVTLWKTLCYECDRFSDFSRVSQVRHNIFLEFGTTLVWRVLQCTEIVGDERAEHFFLSDVCV